MTIHTGMKTIWNVKTTRECLKHRKLMWNVKQNQKNPQTPPPKEQHSKCCHTYWRKIKTFWDRTEGAILVSNIYAGWSYFFFKTSIFIWWGGPYGEGARRSSVVRAFAHGAMVHRIDPSWWTHWAISRSSQCSTTGVTKAVVCIILSVGLCI